MSFGAIADDYDRLRPSPPDVAVDWLLPADCQVAVDLAAGTGLFARALARTVANVVAVEPDARMASVLRARSTGVHVVQGIAEAIPVRDDSADGVFISSAWHWLDPDLAVPEIGRVLRDGGRLGVLWTSRDREVDWVAELDRLRQADQAPADSEAERARTEASWRWRRQITLPDSDLFGVVETAQFTFSRTMTIDDLADMMGTYSGVITATPADRAVSLARTRALLEERFPSATEIDVPMRSWCCRADRTASDGPHAMLEPR
jgi:ubiquinone/menaquinone biosynthesis C-methylase UbiE